MEFIGSPDEIVVADVQIWPGAAKQIANLIGVGLRILSYGGSSFYYFVAVFIGTGEEIGLPPDYGMKAGQHICDDGCVCMAEVGWSIHVVNWRSDVVPR